MDSSLILLAVVGLSATRLVPHALRRREQLSASRSVDRFSAAIRVLARRPERDARQRVAVHRSGVVHLPAILTSPRPDLVDPDHGPRPLSTSAVRVVGARRPGRGAGSGLAGSALAAGSLGVLAWLALVPLWILAVGVGQLLLTLCALRLRARRRAGRRRELDRRPAPARRAAPPRRGAPPRHEAPPRRGASNWRAVRTTTARVAATPAGPATLVVPAMLVPPASLVAADQRSGPPVAALVAGVVVLESGSGRRPA